jgi:outer membrane phospholipase A
MKYISLIVSALVIFSLLLAGTVYSDEPATPAGDVKEKPVDSPQYDWIQRFKPYGMNYAVWNFSSGDDQALEVLYSFKYTLYDCERYELFGCTKDDTTKLNGFFSYTGKFDFYMFTRGSSPVINRTSNPALHGNYEFNIDKSTKSSKWIDLSFEHRSDGQVVDVNTKDTNPSSATFGQYQTEIEYQKGNREFFDRISRDANYFNLAYGQKFRGNTTVDASLKLYVTDDADITWGKYAGTGSKFKDFDLMKLKAYHTFTVLPAYFPEVTFGLEYLIGRKAFAADSVDLYLITPFISKKGGWEIPLMVKAHFGPMDKLSDYARSVNSIGVGVILSF